MLAGKSYYHQPQGIGKVFEPGKLTGYFNDLTHKTNWNGKTDENGVPVNTLSNGKSCQFPITITQKALGHWDNFLINNNKDDKIKFLTISNWLVQNQDDNGGWNTWEAFTQNTRLKYSAMTQGQAISVLCRACKLTNDKKYRLAADKALKLLLTSVKDGGVCFYQEESVFLEESPSQNRKTVLNGWIFALFGLYDYTLIFKSEKINNILNKTLKTLSDNLAQFDSGYWSYYNNQKYICSPFYHNLHINQLNAVSMISDDKTFKNYARKWQNYESKKLNVFRAVLIKAFQKIKEKPKVMLNG